MLVIWEVWEVCPPFELYVQYTAQCYMSNTVGSAQVLLHIDCPVKPVTATDTVMVAMERLAAPIYDLIMEPLPLFAHCTNAVQGQYFTGI